MNGWYVGYSNWGTYLAVYSPDGNPPQGIEALVSGPYPDINSCQIAISNALNSP